MKGPYLDFVSSDFYKVMKENNMVNENDMYAGICGWHKLIVQDIECEYTFGTEDK